MDRRTLPLSALRAFESAADCLHLGQAGERLGVTHGAISHQIRSLEEQLQTQLFSRAHNRLTLTPEGKRLYEAVKAGLDKMLEGARNLNPLEVKGPLVIAGTQTIVLQWGAKYICDFNKKYPDIEITVRDIKPLQKNIPKDIDIAVCYGRPNEDTRLVEPFASPPLLPVCSPRLLRSRGNFVNIEDLSRFVIIHDGQVLWSRWFNQYGGDCPKPISNLYFSNTSQAIEAARLGYGIALANTFETQELIQQGQLIHFLDMPIQEEHSYYLIRQKKELRSLKVQLFEEWIMQARSDQRHVVGNGV